MKDNLSVIIAAAALAFAAVRIYQKYVNKKQAGGNHDKNRSSTAFGSSKDDYEPYSGK